MSSTDRANIENSNIQKKKQIPTEYNEEETLRVLRKQNKVPGEGRVKTINDFPKTAAIGQIYQLLILYLFLKVTGDPTKNKVFFKLLIQYRNIRIEPW